MATKRAPKKARSSGNPLDAVKWYSKSNAKVLKPYNKAYKQRGLLGIASVPVKAMPLAYPEHPEWNVPGGPISGRQKARKR